MIGKGAIGKANNSVTLGNSSVTAVYASDDSGATLYAGGLNLGGTAVTTDAAELNYVDGVTSAIQTQLDAKTGITSTQADAITANTAKTGITTTQADAITANTAKTGITTTQADAITANTAKTGITSTQADAITANTAKTGITTTQADAITANTCLLYTSPSPRDGLLSRMPSSA